jgi:hypothetical protein
MGRLKVTLPGIGHGATLDVRPPRRYHLRGQSVSHFAPMKEDPDQTRRDIRAAIIFGVVAATIELGALLYFFR